MLPTPIHAPWQVAPVSSTGRIAAVALVALALDSAFVWPATPYFIEALALTAIPVLVAIRVIRGFRQSLHAAAMTFGATCLMSLWILAQVGTSRPPQFLATIAAATAISATGMAAIGVGWYRDRRRSRDTIVLTIVHETHDFLRRTTASD